MRRPHTLAVSWRSAGVFPFPSLGPCEAITWRPIRSGAPAERGILETRRRRAGRVRRGNLPHRHPLRLAFALYPSLDPSCGGPRPVLCPIPMFRGCDAGGPGYWAPRPSGLARSAGQRVSAIRHEGGAWREPSRKPARRPPGGSTRTAPCRLGWARSSGRTQRSLRTSWCRSDRVKAPDEGWIRRLRTAKAGRAARPTSHFQAGGADCGQ
jgi:hypothetical protein